ncbi:MAG: DNA translocase FtsK 4TM domain-containing protein [Microthrixaceae bacterium]
MREIVLACKYLGGVVATSKSSNRTGGTRSNRSSSVAGRSGRSTATSRGRTASGSGSRSRATGKSRASGSRRSTTRGGWFSEAFEGYGDDVAGTLLIGVAIICGLGIYGGFGGALGRLFRNVVVDVTGVFAYVVPLLMAAVGVWLIARPNEVEEDPETSASTRRRLVGALVGFAGLAGAAHLIVGPPPISEAGVGVANDNAGGLFGWMVANPLGTLLSRWGALALMPVVLFFAVSLLTGKRMRTLFGDTASALAPVGRLAGDAAGALFRLGPREAILDGPETEEDVDPDAPTRVMDGPGGHRGRFFDQDAGPDTGTLEVPPEVPPVGPPPATSTRAQATPPKPPKVVVPIDDSVDPEQLEMDLGPADGSDWTLPRMDLLGRSDSREVDEAAVAERGQRLEASLAEHGVETRLVGMVVGPTVTRYELELGVGVKVSKVTNLNRDIAYALASSDVRIIAPIPGRQAIGVEVPNDDRDVVALGDILTSAEAARVKAPLEVGIGRDITGRSVMVNLATMPHVLIAGQTGAGKSSCLNSILTSIMMRVTPDQVGLILIDPKRVELTQYDRIPHLLTSVVTDPKKAANALEWAVREMERRYDLLQEAGVRDIGGYNANFDADKLSSPLGEEREWERMRYILVVVDELSDLMMVAARDVENSICRLAQMARAVGIHLVIATQRPSVNVITGVIKANVPARMAFAVASATDSKVVLDQGGAERLVGRGDMLLLGPAASTPQRIQGAWVEEDEVHEIVAHWREQAPAVEARYTEGVADETERPEGEDPVTAGSADPNDDDELLKQAWELVVRSQLGSTSMLQRKLRVGFARAGRLMDLLEERGIVGASEGSKARTVNMTPEELEDLINSGNF